MSLIEDSITIFTREFAIFKANLRSNIIRTAIFPLVILLFFGFLGSAITNVPVVVVNYANNNQASQFISTLSSQNLMQVQAVTTQGAALSMLSSGKVDFVIVILPGFPLQAGSPTVQVYYNNLEFSTTQEILPAIQKDAAIFGPAINFQSQEYLPASGSAASAVTPITGANGNYGDFLFSGVIGMIIVFSTLFSAGIGVLTDKQGGQIKSFLITPINKSAIVLGKILFSAVQSILSIFIVIVIGLLLGNTILMGLTGIVWILILGTLLGITMTGISISVASRMKNMTAFQIFGQTLGLPLWFIAGGIVPVSSFPPILRALSVGDPMTYAIKGFRYVVLQGFYPFSSMVVDVTVLAALGIITTIISILLFKSTID
ncbi:MAG: ABC transporter permease [Candidatus Marsarchaeota archaeon]|jgi:ABC-2 type transport system permease protein|nr:ABC transporter permease [Candidatus Marsarchaeota archaeon]MCL5111879.1 ABC transporter permease [Candidatus Marsarchaeota archaeon]